MIEVLIIKVLVMIMIVRDEVEFDVLLSLYGLDFLVLVELRNWIRREMVVELVLIMIM